MTGRQEALNAAVVLFCEEGEYCTRLERRCVLVPVQMKLTPTPTAVDFHVKHVCHLTLVHSHSFPPINNA